MEKEQRSKLQKATQDARTLLEEEFRSQLLQTYDIDVEKVRVAEEAGAHLQAEQQLILEKLIAWIEHKEAQIKDRQEALLQSLREMAFTVLNRFVALKLMEARELVRPCVSGGLESDGFLEFTAVAQGLLADQESSYRLYLETIFEDVSRELRALFDPRDPASLLWPKRAALLDLLVILNRPELAELWIEDETLGWVYQYFNGDAERKKMREESSAPRNSRELAVRNQFFTPRYVVEFLTDNTLGRIWYEMRQGKTGLKDRCRYLVRRPNEIWLHPGEVSPALPDTEEDLSQEEMLRQPIRIPHRHLKDPRQIRMLDPACGSMHFGLYSFDLYLEIYAESWDISQGSDEQAKSEKAFSTFVAYANGFANKAAFLREVPRLILQHNIHGIDIDHRATQIARLTLWLRAQRAWNEQRVEVAKRARIVRSNVACAEPMPGEADMMQDVLSIQFQDNEKSLVQTILDRVFSRMLLAGEAGALLKIEEEISSAIADAQSRWQQVDSFQDSFFSAQQADPDNDIQGVVHESQIVNIRKDFWANLENKIYEALKELSERISDKNSLRRKLFAEDAAMGFSFIDTVSQKYDAILMNPPFGEASLGSRQYLYKELPETSRDLFAGFVARFNMLLLKDGFLGVLSTRTAFFSDFLSEWRSTNFLGKTASLTTFADLGYGVLDAVVEAAAYVCSRSEQESSVFFNALGSEDKRGSLEEQLFAFNSNSSLENTSVRSLDLFRRAPDCRLLYQVDPFWIRMLRHNKESDNFKSKAGLTTGDDFRYLRLFCEVPAQEIGNRWKWLAKGGEFSRYKSSLHLVVDWNMRDAFDRLRNSDLYGRRGVTYTKRTTSNLSARVLNAGSCFSCKGPGIVPLNAADSHFLLAYLNSYVITYVVECAIGGGDFSVRGSAARDFEPGQLSRLPEVVVNNADQEWFGEKVNALLEILNAQTSGEIDPSFFAPFLAPAPSLEESVKNAFRKAFGGMRIAYSLIGELEKKITGLLCIPAGRSIDTYSDTGWPWRGNDRKVILEGPEIFAIDPFEPSASIEVSESDSPVNRFEMKLSHYLHSGIERYAARNGISPVELCDVLSRDSLAGAASISEAAMSLISYAVGAAFGRWDVRCFTGQRLNLQSCDYFGEIPACPPGQLANSSHVAASSDDIPSEYPLFIPWDGILVRDTAHPRDIERVTANCINLIWDSELIQQHSGILNDLTKALKIATLGEWFDKPSNFFADHLRRYSKSRRYAPLYWLLSAGDCHYSVWLYYQRLTRDTLYLVLRDYVNPRLSIAEQEQFQLSSRTGLTSEASFRLQEMLSTIEDLRILKSELEIVSPLWSPSINDGVIINHAILWRITPYSPWQKKCKECWDKLVKGDYDWAHLAFHLWPERVIRKCATDRSLAIAHGLEERLWQETSKGSWLPRQVSEAELQALLAEYSKPAVQNALERFLAASPPVAAARTRAPRAAKSSSTGTTRRPRGPAAEVDAETSRQTLLVLTAAPAEGLGRNAIAELLGVEAASLTAVIKQLKEGGQIEQLGAARGAKYRLSESGLAAVESQAGEGE